MCGTGGIGGATIGGIGTGTTILAGIITAGIVTICVTGLSGSRQALPHALVMQRPAGVTPSDLCGLLAL